jgi:hypothetical protein
MKKISAFLGMILMMLLSTSCEKQQIESKPESWKATISNTPKANLIEVFSA